MRNVAEIKPHPFLLLHPVVQAGRTLCSLEELRRQTAATSQSPVPKSPKKDWGSCCFTLLRGMTARNAGLVGLEKLLVQVVALEKKLLFPSAIGSG